MRKLAFLAATLAASSVCADPQTGPNFVSGGDGRANRVSGTSEDLDISPSAQERQSLKSFSIAGRDSGARFKVYFDAASEKAAKHSIPAIAWIYTEVSRLTGVPADKIKWDDVLFARNSDALVVANKPWDIDVGADGQLSEKGIQALYRTIPHEQTHTTQDGLEKIPRWYSEGQATWVQIRFAESWAPKLARTERSKLMMALKDAQTPVSLHSWGGVVVKKEAFLRQMTPEQKEKFEKDSILPSGGGHWKFGPEDMISDESNSTARYAASFKIFERIEKEAGLDALQAWFKAVREAKTPLTNDLLMSLAKTHTKIDISNDIK